ncbi:MAG: hypothetical protein KDC87_03995, partial [Planctomycetes bacterium]|nr:hypothetical protein [Planctomycetota bacterium]
MSERHFHPTDATGTEVAERSLTLLLDEAIGGANAPDCADEVLAALASRSSGAPGPRERRWPGLAAAVLVAAALGVVFLLHSSPKADPVPATELRQDRPLPDPVRVYSRADVERLPADTQSVHGTFLPLEAVRALGRLRKLRALDLSVPSRYSIDAKSPPPPKLDAAMVAAIAELRGLEVLRLDRQPGNDLRPLGRLTELRVLSLAGGGADARTLQSLQVLPHLFEIDLRGCRSVDDSAVEALTKFPELRVLRLGMLSWLRPASLCAVLRATRKLEVLDLASVDPRMSAFSRRKAPADAGVDARVVAEIAKLKRLRELDVSNCKRIDDAMLAELAHCTALRRLALGGCDAVTDRGLTALPAELTDLSLDLTAVTGSGLARFPDLVSLGLVHTVQLDPEQVSRFLRGPARRTLHEFRLCSQRPEFARVLDDLPRCTELRVLNLSSNAWMTNAHVGALESLAPRLQRLSLFGVGGV